MLSRSLGWDEQSLNLPPPLPPLFFFSYTEKLEFLYSEKGGMVFALRNTAIWWYPLQCQPVVIFPLLLAEASVAHSVFIYSFTGSLCASYCAWCWDSARNKDRASMEPTRVVEADKL